MNTGRNHHRMCRNRKEVLEYLETVAMAKVPAKAGMSDCSICRSGLAMCANDWDCSECF